MTFEWTSRPKYGAEGHMLAVVSPDGQTMVSVVTNGGASVVLDSRDVLVCERCDPPIYISGRE